VDALAGENRYAVLVKSGRVQILVRPTAKQLRKRGKRGWQLFGTVDAEEILTQTIQGAIESLPRLDEAAEKRRKKHKRSKD
jgi:hypothetical protein